MPTTRKGWQEQIQDPPRGEAGDTEQANEASTAIKRQPKSPPRPSLSPAPELAEDLQQDPNHRSPKKQRSGDDARLHRAPEGASGTSIDETAPQITNHIHTSSHKDSQGSHANVGPAVSVPANINLNKSPLPRNSELSESTPDMHNQAPAQMQLPHISNGSGSVQSNVASQPLQTSPTHGSASTVSLPPQPSNQAVNTLSSSGSTSNNPVPSTSTAPAAATQSVNPASASTSTIPQPSGGTNPSTSPAIMPPVRRPQGQPVPSIQPPVSQTASSSAQPYPNQRPQPASAPVTSQPHQHAPQHTNAMARAPQPQPSNGPPAPGLPPPPSAEAIAELNRLRLNNIATLGDLADQILKLLPKMPVNDAMSLAQDMALLAKGGQPESPAPAEYQRLRGLFDPIRNMYLTGAPFLMADRLQMTDPSHVESLRKANQAMYCSAIFAGGIGQLLMDQGFLEVFVPQHGTLLKSQAAMWLEFKTQAFMTALRMKAAPPEQVMHDLFPAGIENRILARRPGSRSLAPSEQEFVSQFEARKRILQDHVDRNALPDLDPQYPYVNLAKAVLNYLIKTHARYPRVAKTDRTNAATTARHDPSFDEAPSILGISADELERMCNVAMKEALKGTPFEETDSEDESGDPMNQNHMQQQRVQESSAPTMEPRTAAASSITPTHQVASSQPIPTWVLYQQARLVVPKSPPPQSSDSAGSNSMPQPWTDEEEKALMNGIDEVRGPHWNQILELHGPQGTSTTALQNRDQVQLIAKARNLRAFFAKSNIGVPVHLQHAASTPDTGLVEKSAKVESSDTRTAGSNGGQHGIPNQTAVVGQVKEEEPSSQSVESVPRVRRDSDTAA